MAYLEEILPEIRKGRKARRVRLHDAIYLSDADGCLCHVEDGAVAVLTGYELLADDWELVPEPKKYKAKLYLYADGQTSIDGMLVSTCGVSPKCIETREVEWEAPGEDNRSTISNVGACTTWTVNYPGQMKPSQHTITTLEQDTPKMNEIKRYKLVYDSHDNTEQLLERPYGDWVRWYDVQVWLEENSDESLREAFYEASKRRGW
jgi:hypothetical protein